MAFLDLATSKSCHLLLLRGWHPSPYHMLVQNLSHWLSGTYAGTHTRIMLTCGHKCTHTPQVETLTHPQHTYNTHTTHTTHTQHTHNTHTTHPNTPTTHAQHTHNTHTTHPNTPTHTHTHVSETGLHAWVLSTTLIQGHRPPRHSRVCMQWPAHINCMPRSSLPYLHYTLQWTCVDTIATETIILGSSTETAIREWR